MKLSYFLFFILGVHFTTVQAQSDDVYYTPSKEQKAAERVETQKRVKRHHNPWTEDTDNWAEGRRNNSFDTDTYNRRSSKHRYEEEEYYDRGSHDCTERIVRFHSPTGILISSPYYWDYYVTSPFYDPWGWDRMWYSSWSPYWSSWGSPWYYSRWHRPWFSVSWGWSWGFNWGWHSPWSWDYAYHSPIYYPRHYSRGYQYGPVGGGRYYSVNGRTQGYNHNMSNRRVEYQRNIPNSRFEMNGGNSRTAGRSYQNQRPSTPRYETPSQQRTYSPPPSSAPSRSYGGYGGSGSSSAGRTGGSTGGGRSFGR